MWDTAAGKWPDPCADRPVPKCIMLAPGSDPRRNPGWSPPPISTLPGSGILRKVLPQLPHLQNETKVLPILGRSLVQSELGEASRVHPGMEGMWGATRQGGAPLGERWHQSCGVSGVFWSRGLAESSSGRVTAEAHRTWAPGMGAISFPPLLQALAAPSAGELRI